LGAAAIAQSRQAMTRGIGSRLACALLLLLGACSQGTDRPAVDSASIVLGISQVDTVPNWNAANTESIREAAREAGIGLRLEDARRSQENQVAALRSFISQRVDLIAFSPVVETGWEIVLREIRAAGIPVILMDRAIEVSDESLYVSLIGSDFVEQGRRAGRWLLEHTRDLPGEIDIVELQVRWVPHPPTTASRASPRSSRPTRATASSARKAETSAARAAS
jgi:galactofuranose transport system substrate-binding protein